MKVSPGAQHVSSSPSGLRSCELNDIIWKKVHIHSQYFLGQLLLHEKKNNISNNNCSVFRLNSFNHPISQMTASSMFSLFSERETLSKHSGLADLIFREELCQNQEIKIGHKDPRLELRWVVFFQQPVNYELLLFPFWCFAVLFNPFFHSCFVEFKLDQRYQLDKIDIGFS